MAAEKSWWLAFQVTCDPDDPPGEILAREIIPTWPNYSG